VFSRVKVIAERIQKNVHDYQAHVLFEFGSFTTSIGFVALDESCRGSRTLFVEKIDNVLILAKREGKNTIVIG